VEDFKAEIDRTTGEVLGDSTNVLIAHVALTSLPSREWRDINELEVDEAAFGRSFDHVLLGHYHVYQKASKRTWYAGSTDSFAFTDRPKGAGPKGLVVLDTETGEVDHHASPRERPLVTFWVDAEGLSPGELVDATGREGHETPDGAIVRVFLNAVDPSAFRQVSPDEWREAIPAAIHVQVEPDYGAGPLAVQGSPEIGGLEVEWDRFVEGQDLTGLDRDRVRDTGRRFLEDAQAEAS
jgi:hypothetical protein